MSSARLLRGVARFERARSHFALPSPCRCGRLREEPSECVPACSERVERRPDVIRGRISFVSIHTRPTEARDPSPEVYRAVREARQILMVVTTISGGKGLRLSGPLSFSEDKSFTELPPSLTHFMGPCQLPHGWNRRWRLSSVAPSATATKSWGTASATARAETEGRAWEGHRGVGAHSDANWLCSRVIASCGRTSQPDQAEIACMRKKVRSKCMA